MPETTIAAELTAPGQFELRECDLPEAGDDAALLKIEASGICGSDISGSKRLPEGPKILGHKGAGVIARPAFHLLRAFRHE